MINVRIKNSGVSSRTRSQSPNTRDASARVNARGESVVMHVKSSKATRNVTSGGGSGAGLSIGLLLALTYSSGGGSTTNSSDYKPNVNIK